MADTNTTGSEEKSGNKVPAIDGTPNGDMAKAHAQQEAEAKGKDQPIGINNDSMFDEDLMSELRQAEKKLGDIDDARAELNAKKAEIVARLVNKGFNKDGVKAAFKYFRTPVEKRKHFDLSYAATRKALGCPIQDDLFVAAAQRAVDQHQAGKKH